MQVKQRKVKTVDGRVKDLRRTLYEVMSPSHFAVTLTILHDKRELPRAMREVVYLSHILTIL